MLWLIFYSNKISKQKMNQIFNRLIAMKRICAPIFGVKSNPVKSLSNRNNILQANTKSNGIFINLLLIDNRMGKYSNDTNLPASSKPKKQDPYLDYYKFKSYLCVRQTDFIVEGGNHKSDEEIREILKSNLKKFKL